MSAHAHYNYANYDQQLYAQQPYYAAAPVPALSHPVARQQQYVVHQHQHQHVQPPALQPTQITRRCNDCNRGFVGSAQLEQHQNFGRAIQCGVCNMYCACWDMLALHQTSRHAQQHPSSPGPASPASPS